MVGSGTWKCSNESGKYYYVGNQPAAVPDGNPCFCICGYCTDTSYLICRNLCCAWPYRTCRRSCCSRLLCTDGRFCSNVLPRKQMGWSCFSGNRNIHAPDGKYRKKSTHLDCTDPYFCHNRTSCNLSVQTSDERYSGFFRYGYLWFRRTDWCLHWMDE